MTGVSTPWFCLWTWMIRLDLTAGRMPYRRVSCLPMGAGFTNGTGIASLPSAGFCLSHPNISQYGVPHGLIIGCPRVTLCAAQHAVHTTALPLG